jgi:hypothetical protein
LGARAPVVPLRNDSTVVCRLKQGCFCKKYHHIDDKKTSFVRALINVGHITCFPVIHTHIESTQAMGFQQRADSGFRGERPKFREFCRNFLAPHYIRRIHHSTTIHGLRAVVIHVRHSFTSHMVIHAVYIPVYIPYQSIRLFQQRDLTSHPEISEQYLNSTVRGRPV